MITAIIILTLSFAAIFGVGYMIIKRLIEEDVR